MIQRMEPDDSPQRYEMQTKETEEKEEMTWNF